MGILKGDDHRIADGLADDCTCNRGEGCTYNQGVILAALGLLHESMPAEESKAREALIVTADSLAAAAFKRYGVDGVLQELCEVDGCNADAAQFKGIFTRYLAQYLHAVGPASPRASEFHQLLAQNADSIWLSDRLPPAAFGLHWAGPAPAT